MALNGNAVDIDNDDSIHFDTDASEVLLYGHFALDSYAGNGSNAHSSKNSLPAGWEVLLRTGTDAGEYQPSVSTFQATAYRNTDVSSPSHGKVVIAFRGTDDGDPGSSVRELLGTSIPLGMGLLEDTSLDPLTAEYQSVLNVDPADFKTTSYIQAAFDFYTGVLSLATDTEDISFTGHSLGGIVAGYMSGITGLNAMVFDTGPHNRMVADVQWDDTGTSRLIPSIRTKVNPAIPAVDFGAVTSFRIEGEILKEGLDRATSGSYVSLVNTIITLINLGVNPEDVVLDLAVNYVDMSETLQIFETLLGVEVENLARLWTH